MCFGIWCFTYHQLFSLNMRGSTPLHLGYPYMYIHKITCNIIQHVPSLISLFVANSNMCAILLMEEILHHLGCLKSCKHWDNLPTSTGDRRISEPSTVFLIKRLWRQLLSTSCLPWWHFSPSPCVVTWALLKWGLEPKTSSVGENQCLPTSSW